MFASPKISVLLPCYKQAAYLPQAIDSVLSQRNADWELVISDDASPDESVAIIRRYADREQRIRFTQQTSNLGMAANWNWCLQNARGKYVKYLFGDDFHCADDTLATLAAALDRASSAALATSARQIVDEKSRSLAIADHLGPDGVQPGHAALTRCLLAGKNLIGEPSAVMFRRELSARGFDTTYRQSIDLEFWAHLLEQGDLAYISRPLCAFRRHKEQQTVFNARTRAAEQEGLRLYAKYLPLLQQHILAGGSRHAVRRAIFRSLYFARKTSARPPEARAAEQALLAYLTPAGYATHWLLHRVTKPLANLTAALNRSSREK